MQEGCNILWEEVITSANMTRNSRKAWKTINKLSNDPTSSNPPCLVTANQVAHQLLVNGRGTMPSKPKRPVLPPATEGDTSKVYPFSEGEYNKGVAALKNNKAAGRDDILVEQLKHLGPKVHKWLLTMLNIICLALWAATYYASWRIRSRPYEDNLRLSPYWNQGRTLRFQRTTDLYTSYVTRTNSTKERYWTW